MNLKDTEQLPFLGIWCQKHLKIQFLNADLEWSVEVVDLVHFCQNQYSKEGSHLLPQIMISDGVSSELFFWVCFLNSPEMTVDNMGASVHLSPGKTFCQLFPRTTFFSYIGHMLKVVTSKGIVPSSDCSYGVLICTYVCCYSSLLIMEFSLNDCGIGANKFFFYLFLCVVL